MSDQNPVVIIDETPASLPSAAAVNEALSALEQIWNLVPRSERPRVRGDLDDVSRTLRRVLHYLRDNANVGSAGRAAASPIGDGASPREGEGETDDEEGEDMSDELIAKIEQILAILGGMSLDERAATAEAIDSQFCTSCWEELPDEGEPAHVCETDEGETDEEEGRR